MEVRYAPTPYGFTYGPATVTRLCHDKTGAVEIGIDSQKAQVHVYVTKTGKIRVWIGDKELK